MTTATETTEATAAPVAETKKLTKAEINAAKVARAQAIIEEDHSFDQATGIGATTTPAFGKFMTEQGHDVAALNAAEIDKGFFVAGAVRAFTKPAIAALSANKDLNDVEYLVPLLDGQSVTLKGERSRSYINPSNPEADPVVKTLPVRLVYEQSTVRAVGSIKQALNDLSAAAAEALGK